MKRYLKIFATFVPLCGLTLLSDAADPAPAVRVCAAAAHLARPESASATLVVGIGITGLGLLLVRPRRTALNRGRMRKES